MQKYIQLTIKESEIIRLLLDKVKENKTTNFKKSCFGLNIDIETGQYWELQKINLIISKQLFDLDIYNKVVSKLNNKF